VHNCILIDELVIMYMKVNKCVPTRWKRKRIVQYCCIVDLFQIEIQM